MSTAPSAQPRRREIDSSLFYCYDYDGARGSKAGSSTPRGLDECSAAWVRSRDGPPFDAVASFFPAHFTSAASLMNEAVDAVAVGVEDRC